MRQKVTQFFNRQTYYFSLFHVSKNPSPGKKILNLEALHFKESYSYGLQQVLLDFAARTQAHANWCAI